MKLYTFIIVFILCYIIFIDARKIIIIRHGEKISDDYIDLNDKGTARAQCLYKIFNEKSKFGRPQSIYSNKRGNHSHRPYDTVKPLADKLGLQVIEFNKNKPKKFVKKILNKDNSDTILISSSKEWIPSLIKAIGYKKPKSKEVDDFNKIWVIENDNKKGQGKLMVYEQNLETCINKYLTFGTTEDTENNE